MKKILLSVASLLLAAPLYAQVQLGLGVPELIFNANNTAAPITGTVYSVPTVATLLTWITTFATIPASVTVQLECSNDNSAWAACDTTTAITGEVRNLYTAARYVRASETARSGGSSITVSIIAKSSTNPSMSFSSLSTTGNISTSNGRFYAPDGTNNLPAYSFLSETFLGMYRNSANELTFAAGGADGMTISGTNIRMAAYALAWTPVGSTASPDVGLSRISAGVLGLGNSAQGSTSGNIALTKVTYTATVFGSLGTPANGTVLYCSDCLANSNPCTGVSTGAMAKRLNGAWDCR